MSIAQSPKKKFHILVNRNFALLSTGQTISIAGDFFFDTTLLLWFSTQIARGQQWAPLGISAILLASSLPNFVVGPFAGVFVDRWNKRQTMLWMNLLQALFIVLLLLAGTLFIDNGLLPPVGSLCIICLLVFVDSACNRFFIPAVLATINDVVEEKDLTHAMGISQLIVRIPMLLMPPLATFLFFLFGVRLALIFNIISYVISFSLIWMIHQPQPGETLSVREKSNFWREFSEGFQFFFRNRILTTILVASCLLVLQEGATSTLNIFFIQQNLHTPLNWYGFLNAALGAGLILGSVLAAAFAKRIGLVRVLSIGLAISGGLALIYARATAFIPALVILFLQGIIIAATNVATGPIMLLTTPKKLVGRVSTILTPSLSICYSLSVVLVGYLDSSVLGNFHERIFAISFGPIDTIYLGTGILALLGGFYAFFNLRRQGQVIGQEEKELQVKNTTALENSAT